MKRSSSLWIGLGVLVLLSPLGIILPARYNSGSAWGEWSTKQMKNMIGYVPAGMTQSSDKWKAPLPDYARKNTEGASLRKQGLEYIMSGILGVIVIVGLTAIVGTVVARRDKTDTS